MGASEVLDATVTESSPVPEAPSGPDTPQRSNVESLSDAERSEWLKTGNLPTQSAGAEPKNGVNGNSQPVEESAEPAPSSNGKSSQETEYKAKTEQRFQQLLEERRRDRAELEQLRAQITNGSQQNGNGVTRTSPPEPAQSGDTPKPQRPEESDYSEKGWEAYQQAVDQYYEDLADWKADQRFKAHQATNAQRAEQMAREYHTRQYTGKLEQIEAETAKRYRDYDEVTLVAQEAIRAAQSRAIFDYLGDVTNPNIAEVLYHLGKHPEKVSEISKLPYPKACLELARFEESISSPPVPPVNKSTKAPPPPPTITAGKTAATDEAAAALADGDYARYERVMNAREKKPLRQ